MNKELRDYHLEEIQEMLNEIVLSGYSGELMDYFYRVGRAAEAILANMPVEEPNGS